MAKTAVLGFPRMGKNRELKKALESYWKGERTGEELEQVAKSLRAGHWQLMKQHHIDSIPSNDFSYYDQMLDTICMTGAVPKRYGWSGGVIDHDLYFSMARGGRTNEANIPAMEMTKWFDTNYHYIVPEFESNQQFSLSSKKAVEEFNEAKAMGLHTSPVLIGPVTFLLLGKMTDNDRSVLLLLDRLLPVYEQLLNELALAGADWIQMDEPCMVLDREEETAAAMIKTYQYLSSINDKLKIRLAAYFGSVEQYLDVLSRCPVDGLHIDLARAPGQLDKVLDSIRPEQQLSLGVINGRNIWRTDLESCRPVLEKAAARLGKERVLISSSCSLLHVPFSLDDENKLNPSLKNWLAFSKEKLEELNLLGRLINEGGQDIPGDLKQHQHYLKERKESDMVNRPEVNERMQQIDRSMLTRRSGFEDRKIKQQQDLKLPVLPTTTIGSFPQTAEVRLKRKDFKNNKLSQEDYNRFLKEETAKCIAFQEAVGLDVLVHGEFERNDMVEYFGEHLDGFAFTSNGWVQSYGSRCVKPPVIYGDVQRQSAMTVEWSSYAQSLTGKPVKGMLTGPVTILQWSFVRDDQPREETCKQIALAIRDEVADLEAAGIKIIQIDEPALREGLPLNKPAWPAYLRWGVDSFRLASSVVRDETQIHTHMCYGDFEDILGAIAELDADVISIEASRSDMVLLKAFGEFNYPNDVGPGVYDIHSPLIPAQASIVAILEKAMQVVPAEQLWINPDCGLKTRGWPEVKASLANMVSAARQLRSRLSLPV